MLGDMCGTYNSEGFCPYALQVLKVAAVAIFILFLGIYSRLSLCIQATL